MNRAFTIIELLVVILVIAVLGALLYPSMKAMRSASDTAEAASDMRAIFTASAQFATEHRGFLPFTSWPSSPGYPNPLYPGSTTAPSTYWYLQIHPYLYGDEMKGVAGQNDKVDGLFRLRGFRGYKLYQNRPINGRWDAIDFITVSRWRASTSEAYQFPNLLRISELSNVPFLLAGYNEGDAGIDSEARFNRYCYHPGLAATPPTAQQLPLGTAWIYNNRLAVTYCDGHTRFIPFENGVNMYQKVFNQR